MADQNPYAAPAGQSYKRPDRKLGEFVGDSDLPMTATAVFNADVYWKYHQSGATFFPFALRVVAGIVGAAGTMIGTLLMLTGALDGEGLLIALGVGSVIIIPSCALVAWSIYSNRFARRRLERTLEEQGRESENVVFTISADSLTLETEMMTKSTKWVSMAAIVELKEFVVLCQRDGSSQLFPIRQLPLEFIEAVKELAAVGIKTHSPGGN